MSTTPARRPRKFAAHLAGLVPIATISGRQFIPPHEWDAFTAGKVRHVYAADMRDPQIAHPLHVSRIAGRWPEAAGKARAMRTQLLREMTPGQAQRATA